VIGPTQRTLLETHNIHKRQTSLPPEGFEPATPANEPPQTHALDRAAMDRISRSYFDIKNSYYGMYVQLIGINKT
jgi:hypothetical protein